MADSLVLVHTVPPLIEVFDRLAAAILPGVRLLHVLDEPLLERVRQRGRLAGEDTQHLAAHVMEAERIGAAAVLVTCSTISPCVDAVRSQAHLPVVRIDELMIKQAIERAIERAATPAQGTQASIGVIATNRTALEPVRQMLLAAAKEAGQPLAIELVMVEGALPALLAGEGARHDDLVRQAVLDLAERVDVIMLAQASTARVLAVMEPDAATPVLSSPHLALRQVAQLLQERGRDE